MLVCPAQRVAARLPPRRRPFSTSQACLNSAVQQEPRAAAALPSLVFQSTHDGAPLHSHSVAFPNPMLYEDRALLVVNKPPGFCVQANTANPNEAGLIRELTDKYVREQNLHCDVLPCHRIDKPTTGIVLCGKSVPTVRDIVKQFAERSIEKTYLALLRTARDIGESGTIDAPLGSWKGRPCIAREGYSGFPAVTRWERLAVSPRAPIQLVKFMPETGRKHQIRIHTAQVLRAPVLGDDLYAEMKRPRRLVGWQLPEFAPGALFLHSSSISLYRYRRTGPSKRFRLGLTAPLPQYFVDVCRALEITIPEQYTRSSVSVDGERVENGIIEAVDGKLISLSGT